MEKETGDFPVLMSRVRSDGNRKCPASTLVTLHEQAAEAPAVPELEQVYLFVNPLSGGGRAGAYLEALGSIGGVPVEVNVGPGRRVNVWCFDIRDGPSGMKPGFQKLCDMVTSRGESPKRQPTEVRVLIAGGDGTVMWAISELTKMKCDMSKVAVGHIPFGTGNDFSRSTGWGPKAPANLIGANHEYLVMDLRKWLEARVIDFDVWEIEVTTTDEGGFLFVHGPSGKDKALTDSDKLKHGLEQLPGGGWRMRKPMVNYFSLGQTCRAGLGFEKKRTSSRLGNFARYGWEGLKKLALRPAPSISDVLEEFTIAEEAVESAPRAVSRAKTEKTFPNCELTPSDSFASQACHDVLSERTAELLFLNVPSFAAGADPWTWAAAPFDASQDEEDLSVCPQQVGDGKLEVISYRSGVQAMIDAANGKVRLPGRGAGRRLASARGPFVSDFKPPEEATYTSSNGKVYFQIDGEFFVVTQPQQAIVRHQRTVKVLLGGEARGSRAARRAATAHGFVPATQVI